VIRRPRPPLPLLVWLVLALLASAWLAVRPPLARSAALPWSGVALGVQDDALLTSAEPDAWPLAAAVHPRVIRYNLPWNVVGADWPSRPADPGDPAYDWTMPDLVAQRAKALGAAAVFTVVGAPDWANGGHAPSYAPSQAADLGRFCSAVGRRYSGTYVPSGAAGPLPAVNLYTVWNEPNRGTYFQPQGPGGSAAPRLEAGLYRACAGALHRANPRVKVALGPLASRGANGGLPPLDFLAAYRLAGGPRPDALALNPYMGGLLPVYRPTEVTGDGALTLRNLDQLQATSRRAFGSWLPVWLTEFAWRVGPVPRLGEVSPARQAALTRASLALVRTHYPWVRMFVWFLLRDPLPAGGWRSGLVGFGWKPEPVYAVWASGSWPVTSQGLAALQTLAR
jgi:hypothetical protein